MDLEKKRLALHEYLCGVLGSRYCYYSPPTGIEMKYPCIVYSLNGMDKTFADNIPYFSSLDWDVTVIDEDPDSPIAGKMMGLKNCRFDRGFPSKDMNHFVFTLKY